MRLVGSIVIHALLAALLISIRHTPRATGHADGAITIEMVAPDTEVSSLQTSPAPDEHSLQTSARATGTPSGSLQTSSPSSMSGSRQPSRPAGAHARAPRAREPRLLPMRALQPHAPDTLASFAEPPAIEAVADRVPAREVVDDDRVPDEQAADVRSFSDQDTDLRLPNERSFINQTRAGPAMNESSFSNQDGARGRGRPGDGPGRARGWRGDRRGANAEVAQLLSMEIPGAPASKARPAVLVFPSRQTEVEESALYVADVTVDAEGFVIGAHLAHGFGGPRDVEAGAQVWRFRYSPALDDDGRPIRSTIQQKFAVAW